LPVVTSFMRLVAGLLGCRFKCVGVCLVLCTCAPGVDDRCGGGYYWHEGSHTCLKKMETPDASGLEDAAVPGLGASCFSPVDCENYTEASYCLQQSSAMEGYCTIPDCLVKPDDCPEGYVCCDFKVESIPNFCTEEQQFEETLHVMCENG
jgi:hypothetical protein